MQLSRDWIASHIPHQGRMCLLDEVVRWDAERILCSSNAHREADHPLRALGRLGIASGIELAAQAMALHGALTADESDTRPRAGLLAALRGVRLYVARLDDVPSALLCEAVRVAGDQATALYDFELRAAERLLLCGRATVVLDKHAMTPLA
jgi:predicted hotdog family 3-hydroxylacyl-ACP dehydratase